MSFRNLILHFLFFAVTCCQLFGQGNNYVHYTIDEGLPSNSVYGAVQDSRGYIWIYTEKGITRFDGYDFKVYTVQDGLPVNDIWSISEDFNGRLWINCFSEDRYYIEGDSIKKFVIVGPKAKAGYTNFMQFNGQHFLASRNPQGKYLQQGSDTLIFKPINSTTCFLNNGYGVEYYFNHSIHFLDGLVLLINSKTKEVASFPTPRSTLLCKGYFPRPSHKGDVTYSCCEHKGVNFWNHRINKHFLVDSVLFPEVSLSNRIRIDYTAGYFQLNTQNRLLVLDDTFGIVDQLDFGDLPLKNKIANAMRDRNGNYWIGTKNTGLYFLSQQSKNAQLITPRDKRIEVVEGYDTKVLCGSNKGVLLNFEHDQLTDLSHLSKPNRIRTICFKNKEEFAIGYDFYLLFVNNGKVSSFKDYPTIAIGFESTSIYKQFFNEAINVKSLIYRKEEDAYYLGTGFAFIKINVGDSIRIELLKLIRTNALQEGNDGIIWVGTSAGLRYWSKEKEELISTSGDELLQKFVTSISKDSKGRIWAGTDGYGIYCYSQDSLFTIDNPNFNVINTLFIDHKDRLWAGTNKGVIQIEIDADNPSNSAIKRRLTPKDGLPTNEVHALYVDSLDMLYVGTSKGMVQIDLQFKYDGKPPPRLYIDKVLVNDSLRDITSLKSLSYAENRIEVFYTAISNKSHKNIWYEVTLNGNKDKTTISRNRNYTLEAQKPGKFHIEIRARDIDGVYSEKPIELDIEIQPPFWQTTIFRIAMLSAFLLIMYFFSKFREREIKRKEQEKSKLNKKFAELELNALQSQMNPHFVFNSLGAIQYYINKNNVEMADDYLSQFAYLMRLFLESSKNKYITLEQEIQLLQLYVQIEQMRFPQKFEFDMQISKEVSPYSTQIPSMLLQPFIENSINHGLFHKEGNGKLLMDIFEKEDYLVCIIEDNGIGRAAAQKIKEQSKRNYVSRGMQIVEDRINTLNQIENNNITIQTEDLSENGVAAGTRVTVSFKMDD